MKIHELQPQIYYYSFGPNKPALTVHSGDRVMAKTLDAGGFNEKLEPLKEEKKQRSDTTSFFEAKG